MKKKNTAIDTSLLDNNVDAVVKKIFELCNNHIVEQGLDYTKLELFVNDSLTEIAKGKKMIKISYKLSENDKKQTFKVPVSLILE